MAEIHIQKKKKSTWPLIIGILVVLLLLAFAWWYYNENGSNELMNVTQDTSAQILVETSKFYFS